MLRKYRHFQQKLRSAQDLPDHPKVASFTGIAINGNVGSIAMPVRKITFG
jgi:hypothetical protein